MSNNSWIRGTCQYGIIPANGLLYAPPNACACFLTVKADGFFAAAPQRDKTGRMPFPDRPVLEKGPAYEELLRPSSFALRPSDDWPMYRHDPSRSGAGASAIPDAVRGAVVRVARRQADPARHRRRQVFVASTDAHTLHALAAGDGREIWRFTAGGRIDSSPTVWNQTVLFGSADGWIYCVGAADGALAWRFRAAPAERLVGVHGQLESIWPVHGAVLIQNDTLYATAGRSSYLDGGIVLYRLDPATGKELSKTTLYHLNPDTGEQLVPEAKFNMEGTTNDILSGDGELVFLKYFTFDRAGVRTETTRPHLFSITGLLGEDWFVRTYWIVGEGMPAAGWGGWANAANTFPSGQILSFNSDTVYGYGREKLAGGPVGHRADTYRLFGVKRTAAAPPAAKKGKGKSPGQAEPLWTDPHSLIVRAMVLGKDRLAVAGPRGSGEKDPNLLAFTNESEARAGFEGKKGVSLRIVSAADGKTLSECELPAMPVFDGLAAANGRLYLSTLDGKVLCLAEKVNQDAKGRDFERDGWEPTRDAFGQRDRAACFRSGCCLHLLCPLGVERPVGHAGRAVLRFARFGLTRIYLFFAADRPATVENVSPRKLNSVCLSLTWSRPSLLLCRGLGPSPFLTAVVFATSLRGLLRRSRWTARPRRHLFGSLLPRPLRSRPRTSDVSRSMPNTSASSPPASRFDLPREVAADTAASASAAISSS